MKMIRNRSSGNHSSLTTDWMLALCVVLLCHDRGVTSFHLSLSLSRSLSLWLSSNHLRIGFFVCTSSRVRRVFSNRTICQYSRAKGNDKKPRTVCERIPQCTTVTASHSHCSQVAFGLSSLPWTWTWNNSLLLLHVGFFFAYPTLSVRSTHSVRAYDGDDGTSICTWTAWSRWEWFKSVPIMSCHCVRIFMYSHF